MILTGAGFTRNFGAPLAREMWAWILNEPKVRRQPRLQALLRKCFDFELVHERVHSGNYTESEVRAIDTALANTFSQLDDGIRSYFAQNVERRVDGYTLFPFLREFAGPIGSPGLFFSLNQDLFIERFLPNGEFIRSEREFVLALPGVLSNVTTDWLKVSNRFIPERVLEIPTDRDEVATRIEGDLSQSNLAYIKLHGSFGWQVKGGSPLMVVGATKPATIGRNPLLRSYFQLFKRALCQPNQHLLVIGYGFSDAHINQVIARSAARFGLKLYIVSPDDPRSLRKHILSTCDNDIGWQIWSGLTGYFQSDLAELCGDRLRANISSESKINSLAAMLFEQDAT